MSLLPSKIDTILSDILLPFSSTHQQFFSSHCLGINPPFSLHFILVSCCKLVNSIDGVSPTLFRSDCA